MIVLPVNELLLPVADSQPCGPDLSYDPDFMALEVAAQGIPERQAGNDILPSKPPFWPEVHEAALALARRTRDLRIAVLLARAGARLGGITGYAGALSLVAGLLDRYWTDVHPRLDAASAGDATMRLNALTPLSDLSTGLADLRESPIGQAGTGLNVRLIELAWTTTDAWPGESRPTQAGVLPALRRASAADQETLPALMAVQIAVTSIEQTIARHVGLAGPDLKPLRLIAEALAQAAGQLNEAGLYEPVGAPSEAMPVVGESTGGLDAIQSRKDVVRTLDLACEWIEQHEPSNPAPLLIRRAQRLMSKSFLELVRDLAPGGASQVEQIAGVGPS